MAMASYAPLVSSHKTFLQFPCNLLHTSNSLSFSDLKAPIFSSTPTHTNLLQHKLTQITGAYSDSKDLPAELVEDSISVPLNAKDPKDLPAEPVEDSKFVPLNIEDANDLPPELVEDSKFVPLNSEDPKFGPPVLLLMGFSVEEAEKIQQLLNELGGEFLKIVFCTEKMIDQSLWDAVNTEQSNLDVSKIATSLPRICILSGLTGEEMMMFIDAFPETGLELPAFAALVPNSADKPVSEVIEEIMGDHELLSARESS